MYKLKLCDACNKSGCLGRDVCFATGLKTHLESQRSKPSTVQMIVMIANCDYGWSLPRRLPKAHQHLSLTINISVERSF